MRPWAAWIVVIIVLLGVTAYFAEPGEVAADSHPRPAIGVEASAGKGAPVSPTLPSSEKPITTGPAFYGGPSLHRVPGAPLLPDPGHLNLTLNPYSGLVGSEVNATGSGFPSGLVNLTFGSSTSNLLCVTGNLTANSTGDFTCVFSVPLVSAGKYLVTANNSTTVAKANFTVSPPTLNLAPSHGFVGSVVWANGSGYESDKSLDLEFGGNQISSCLHGMGSIETDQYGNLSCAFTVPNLTAGPYAVTASDGTNTGTATYTIDPPTLSLSPSSGTVGTTVEVSGTGYVPAAKITVTWDGAGSLCPSASADATGGFSCSFAAPSAVRGYHTVEATDSTNSASAVFQINPSLSLSPTSGVVGSSVGLSGAGFAGLSTITVTWDGSGEYCPSTSTDTNGSFSCSLQAPAAVAGSHDVMAKDAESNSASATFTIVAALALNATSGTVGSSVTAAGTGFDGTSSVTFYWNSTTSLSSCNVPTDSNGNFSCTFDVPPAPGGSYDLKAVEGGNTATASFKVLLFFEISPSAGIPGVSVSLSGTGFAASTNYDYCLQPAPATACSSSEKTFTTNTNGGIPSATTFTVPSEPAGDYEVDVSLSGTLVASAPFTVTSATLGLTPSSGPAGTVTTLSGSDFTASTSYAYCFGPSVGACPSGTTTTFTATSSGDVPSGVTLTVPATPGGSYYVDVSQGSTFVTVADFSVTALLTLSASSGTVGESVTATGSGFAADSSFGLDWDSSSLSCSGVTSTNSEGGFSCAFTVPASTAGAHVVAAVQGHSSATASFTVTSSLEISPSSGDVGSSLSASGLGFDGVAAYVLDWQGFGEVCSGTTSGTGSFSCSFSVPASPAGPHLISAVEGSNAPSTTFTVTPEATLAPSSGHVGGPAQITGNGFDASSPFSVVWNSGSIVCSGTTDAEGNLSCSFDIPASPAGPTPVDTLEGTYRLSANFTVNPAVEIVPSKGPIGASVEISGTGFNASTVYTVVWNTTQTVCAGVTNGNGSFSCPFAVPASPSGPTIVTVTAGPFAPMTQFNVVPTLVASPATGGVGSSVIVSGTGFPADLGFSVDWNLSTVECQGITTSGGSFTCSFVVPVSPGGPHTVTATAGSVNATTLVTVSPELLVAVPQGPVGTTVGFEGTGFAPVSSYTLWWNSSFALCSGMTNSNGAFGCNGTIPLSPGGLYTLKVLEGPFSATASFTLTPNLALSTSSGPNGADLIATGTGFAASASYTLDWNSSATVCSGTTSTNGGFVCVFLVPASPGGAHSLVAVSGGLAPSATFEVLAALAVSPSSAVPGGSVTIEGTGYPVNALYSVSWGHGPTLCSGSTSTNGAFTCVFIVPSVTVGNYTISATVGSTTSTLTLSVGSTPPTGSGSSAFPWWLVGTGVAIAVAAFLLTLIALGRRRRAPQRAGGFTPWEEGAAGPLRPGTPTSTPLTPPPPPPIVPPLGASPPTQAAAEPPPPRTEEGPAPDIDELMVRLERIQQDLLKKTPKEVDEVTSDSSSDESN